MSAKIITIAALTLLATLYLVHHQTANKQTGLAHFDHEFYASQQQLLSYGNKEVNYEMLYLHYKKIHNLNFGAAEDSTRFTVFKSNCDKILTHNAKNSSYELGLTDLAHLTREEFAATRLGYAGAQKKKNNDNAVILNTDNLAETVDWTTKGAVTDIKNQGQCGSCWSFSTTGALEGLNAIQNGKLVSLSEQELVDCSTSYGNNGCNGGLMDYGFQYAADKGLSAEAAYPYTAADGTCQSKGKDRVYQNKGFQDVAADEPDQLAAALNNGPVSVAIEADTDAFQLYKTGIITGDACGTQLDHGVLAVGYGKDHFKVKNSWGASWGQAGFVLIGRANGDGVCGINEDASYPTQ